MGGPPGDTAIYPANRPVAIITADCIRFSAASNLAIAEYLQIAVESRIGRSQIIDITTGVAHQKVSLKRFRAIWLPLPPLAEQRRIVAKVHELMALCDELEARQEQRHTVRRSLQTSALEALSSADSPDALAEAWNRVRANWDALTARPDSIRPLRQAILELAVRGRLVPQDPNDEPARELLRRSSPTAHRASARKKPKGALAAPVGPLLLPNGWEWAVLSDITDDIQIGPFGSLLHKRDYVTGGIPLINPQNIRDGKIEPTASKTVTKATLKRLCTYAMRAGDVVMGRRGEMGKCAIVTERENGWLCGTGSLFLRLPDGVLPSFIAQFLRSPYARSALLDAAVGSTMNNLSQKALKSLLVGLPPVAEQQRIVAKLDELMALCDEFEHCLQAELETSARFASASARSITA
jgi:type I restriction enzyme S subunit